MGSREKVAAPCTGHLAPESVLLVVPNISSISTTRTHSRKPRWILRYLLCRKSARTRNQPVWSFRLIFAVILLQKWLFRLIFDTRGFTMLMGAAGSHCASSALASLQVQTFDH